MELRELKKIMGNCHIIRNGIFNTLGLTANKYERNEKVLAFLNSKKFLEEFRNNLNISCIICTEEVANEIKDLKYIGICIHPNPKDIFFKVHNYLALNTEFYGHNKENIISSTAKIHPSAVIADKNVTIGENVIIEANVTIYEGTYIGSNVIIKAGVVIGTDGFQYVKHENKIYKVHSKGCVEIHDNVEIHPNTCIEKGVLGGVTQIGKYTKIDNLVLIGHDSKIGDKCFLTTGVKIGGRVTIKDNVFMGISSAVRNGVSIGSNVKISIGAIVTKNVEDGAVVSGNFAIEHDKYVDFIKSIR